MLYDTYYIWIGVEGVVISVLGKGVGSETPLNSYSPEFSSKSMQMHAHLAISMPKHACRLSSKKHA